MILGGFELLDNAFPVEIKGDVYKVLELIPLKTYNNCPIGTSEETMCYWLNCAMISIPYRVYYIDISDDVLENLSLQQQMILHCIYSRSCNGFVRQKHLKLLLSMDYAVWTIPFIVKLCDEYVVEILEITYEMLKVQDTECIKEFCFNNVESFCKSHARMISYWNEFYRDRTYKYKDYIGRKLFNECFGYSRSMERRKLT